MKAIFFFLLGCAATYLYLNPGDIDGLVEITKTALNDGATYVKDATD